MMSKNVADFQPAPVREEISLDLLRKVDIRVGSIEGITNVRKSAKLVKLTVNFGDHKRTILAGLRAERADPMELFGRQALFVVNVAPRKVMGEYSEGMLFDIGYDDGIIPVLAVPERVVPNGARLG